MKWIHTIDTVVEVETSHAKSQWRIGDAIAKDLAGAESALTRENYGECANLLKTKGFDNYDASYLAKLHRTAVAFLRSERDDRYSWDVHYEAGAPGNLKKATAALRKLNKTITQYNMRWLMQEWREKADADRKKANEAARREEEAAKKKAAQAAERALKAKKNSPEKEQAQKEHEAAKEEARQAKQRKNATAHPPAFNADIDTELHDQDTLDQMAIHLGIVQELKRTEKAMITAQKEAIKISNSLTPAQQSEIFDGSNRIIDIVQQLKAVVRGRRLRVHEGGVA